MDMALALPLLILLLAAPAIYAADHTVGGSGGWTNPGDYTTWAAGEKFIVGDKLVFSYSSNHAVDEVNAADYGSCTTGNALKTYTGGSTTITLTTAGPMYFICPTPGHCSSGMKLAVNVTASSTTPSTPPSGSTTPPPPSSTTPSDTPPSPAGTTASPPPPPPSGVAGSYSHMSYWVFGFSVVVAIVVGIMG